MTRPAASDIPLIIAAEMHQLLNKTIFCHRGMPRRYPENTLASFKEALNVALQHPHLQFGLECDVRWSADEQIIIFHDARLERVTHSSGLVRDKTLDQLQQLSFKTVRQIVGSDKRCDPGRTTMLDQPRDNTQNLHVAIAEDDIRIPTLEEILILIQTANKEREKLGYKSVRFGIDLKLDLGGTTEVLEPVMLRLQLMLRSLSRDRLFDTPILPPRTEQFITQLSETLLPYSEDVPTILMAQNMEGHLAIAAAKQQIVDTTPGAQIRTQASTSHLPFSLDTYQFTSGGVMPDAIGLSHDWLASGAHRLPLGTIRHPKPIIEQAHAQNMDVHAFTLIKPKHFKRWLRLGADGFITDRPERAVDFLNTQLRQWETLRNQYVDEFHTLVAAAQAANASHHAKFRTHS